MQNATCADASKEATDGESKQKNVNVLGDQPWPNWILWACRHQERPCLRQSCLQFCLCDEKSYVSDVRRGVSGCDAQQQTTATT